MPATDFNKLSKELSGSSGFFGSFLLFIIRFFQPQRGHFIDALQNLNSYDKYKPKVDIEKSSDTTTAELF